MNTYITFEEFTEYVERNLLTGWRDEGELRVEKVRKNNGLVLTGIVIYTEESNIAPTLYLEEAYGDYCMGMPLDKVMEMIRCQYEQYENMLDLGDVDVFDYEEMKDQIIFRVVNYRKNKELLEDCPYIRIHDLAVTFRSLMIFDNASASSALISDSLMEEWGITMEELILIARENTRRIFPERIMSLREMVEGEEATEPEMMYVATNVHMLNGASVILYDGVLDDFSRKIRQNFYVLPSSVHEMIFIPENMVPERETLSCIVREANEMIVDEEEILSDSVYYYNSEKGTLSCLA